MAAPRFVLIPSLALLLGAAPNLADAQWWAHRHAARMSAMHNAHVARVRVPPAPVLAPPTLPPASVSVDTPYYSYRYNAPAPLGAPANRFERFYGWSGPHGVGGVSVSVSKPLTESYESTPTPTPADADGALIEQYDSPEEQLAAEHAALMARLELYNGGEGWQSYFTMPEGGEADRVQRGKLLRRMDSVAQDAQFSKVSHMPEFRRVHQTLQTMNSALASQPAPQIEADEVAAQSGPEVLQSEAESLPVPAPEPAPADTIGEHSVLKPVN